MKLLIGIKRTSLIKGASTRYERFNKFIQDNNLIDLGFQSNKFTWYNKGKAEKSYFCCTRSSPCES